MPFEECLCHQLGKTVRKVTRTYRDEITAYIRIGVNEDEAELKSADAVISRALELVELFHK